MPKHEIPAYAIALAELLSEAEQTLGPTDRDLCARGLRLLASIIDSMDTSPGELDPA